MYVQRVVPRRSPVNTRIPPAVTLDPGGLLAGAAPLFSPILCRALLTLSQPSLSLYSLVQVDSLSVTLGPLGVPELMVSQPGCAYAVLLCTWNKDARHSTTSEGTTEGIR